MRLNATEAETGQYISLGFEAVRCALFFTTQRRSGSCLPLQWYLLRSARQITDPVSSEDAASPFVNAARHHSPAFSLVETALAIGVIAFAFVGLLALLPAGLSNFRSAVDTSVGAQIFQRVVSDAEQADFDLLTGTASGGKGDFYVLPTRFFDDQGSEIVPQIPGRPSGYEGQQIIYHVHVRGSRPGPDSLSTGGTAPFTSLPAAPRTRRFSPRDSTFLTIQIAHYPGIRTLPLNAQMLVTPPTTGTGPLSIVTYSAVITRNGFVRKKTP